MCSHIDMQTHAGRLGLVFDLSTSGSVHAVTLPWTVCLPTLVLIAQVVFFFERGQTNRQTRLSALPHTGGYTAGVGNNLITYSYL